MGSASSIGGQEEGDRPGGSQHRASYNRRSSAEKELLLTE